MAPSTASEDLRANEAGRLSRRQMRWQVVNFGLIAGAAFITAGILVVGSTVNPWALVGAVLAGAVGWRVMERGRRVLRQRTVTTIVGTLTKRTVSTPPSLAPLYVFEVATRDYLVTRELYERAVSGRPIRLYVVTSTNQVVSFEQGSGDV